MSLYVIQHILDIAASDTYYRDIAKKGRCDELQILWCVIFAGDVLCDRLFLDEFSGL